MKYKSEDYFLVGFHFCIAIISVIFEWSPIIASDKMFVFIFALIALTNLFIVLGLLLQKKCKEKY